jgi:hypothetical protein
VNSALATIVFFMALPYCVAQPAVLRVTSKWNPKKNFEIFCGDRIEYKLRHEKKPRKNRVEVLHDSLVVMDDGLEFQLKQLKWIRLKRQNHVIDAFQRFFIQAGILFITLDTANNLLLERPTVVSKKALIISLGLAGTGLVIKRAGYKKLRMKYRTMKIISMDYQR